VAAAEVVRSLVATFAIQVDQKKKKEANEAIESVKSKLKTLLSVAAGSAAAVGLYHVAKQAIDTASKLNDTAKQLGVTTQAVEELGYAASVSGSSQEELVQGLTFLQRSMNAAAGGSADAQAAFARLGVSIQDASGKLRDPASVVDELADGMSRIENPTERAGVAMQVLGRGGGKLVQFFAQGSASIAEARKELQELGGVSDPKFIEDATALNDAMTKTRVFLASIGRTIARALMPFLLRAQQGFLKLAKTFGDVGRSRVDAFVRGVGKLLETVGRLVSPIISALWRMRTVVFAVGVALAAAFAPVTTAIAALLLIIDDVWTYLEGGDSVIGGLIDALERFFTSSETILGSIGAMIWTLVKTLMSGGFGAVWDAWTAALFHAQDTWFEVFRGIWEYIKEGFAAAGKYVVGLLDPIIKTIAKAIDLGHSVASKLGFDRVFAGMKDVAVAVSKSVQFVGQDPVVRPGSGGASSPAAAAAIKNNAETNNNSAVLSPRITNTINVTTGAGQNPEEVATSVRDAVNASFDSAIRSAYNSIIPWAR
jgi:hypothetical protein